MASDLADEVVPHLSCRVEFSGDEVACVSVEGFSGRDIYWSVFYPVESVVGVCVPYSVDSVLVAYGFSVECVCSGEESPLRCVQVLPGFSVCGSFRGAVEVSVCECDGFVCSSGS